MAYRYFRSLPRSGNVVTPHEVNANLKEYAQEWNGNLDRDNLPAGSIADVKIAQDTFSKLAYTQLDSGSFGTLAFTTRFGEPDGRWREITDCVKTIITLDSRVRCIFSCQIETVDAGLAFFGIKVDEHIYGIADGAAQGKRACFAQAAPVLSAGTHRVVPVIKLINAVDRSLATNIFAVTMHHRTLFTREVRR